VKSRACSRHVAVSADGRGLVSQAGVVLLWKTMWAARHLRRKVMVRADSGGTHEFLNWLTARSRRLHYSVGTTITWYRSSDPE
jgi:hypothetical protein